MSQLPDGYRVELDAYAGPLDLLLFLVRRHEIDLNDIPIAELTDQYLQHLKVIETIDVEKAGEFLVMAATLLEIKSQMLMPHVAEDDEQSADAQDAEGETHDPRVELVQQLLAYKRYKDLSVALERRHDDWQQRYAIHPARRGEAEPDPDNAKPRDLDLDDVHVMDLCAAFARILETVGDRGDHQVTYDDTPISLHAADIVDRLQREGSLTLRRMFEGRQNRSEMIGLFLAVLELVRDFKVGVAQNADSGDVELALRPEADAQATARAEADEEHRDWRDPQTGEVQYHWPDEAARQRAERRARRRATLQRNRDAASDDADATGPDMDEDDFDDDDDEPVWNEEADAQDALEDDDAWDSDEP